MNTLNEKNMATLTHLSVLSQYFIPFGNYIFPLIIWSSKKNESVFMDKTGKQVMNFQMSIFIYSLIICLIAIPVLLYKVLDFVSINDLVNNHNYEFNNAHFGDIAGFTLVIISSIVIFSLMKVFEFFLVIYGAVKASNGEEYKYPLTISFFK